MKKNCCSSFLVLLLFVLISCGDDKMEGKEEPNLISNGAYILNSGRIGSNTASLDYYELNNNSLTKAVFFSSNQIGLGDLGQDLLIYGNKMYISVTNSGIIYVLDKTNCKILNTISSENSNKLQPREFEAFGGKVYVTLFDGYLARIDTLTMQIDKKIKVGLNPEGLKVVNNKIYVANSGGLNWQGGYDKTVSVVNLDLSRVLNTITVGVNPVELKTDKYKNLYLVSRGDNFGGISAKLQQIDTATDSVKILKEGGVYSIYINEDKIYILNKEWVNNKPVSTIVYYDIANKTVVPTSFITDGTAISDINAVEFHPISKDIYVTAADGVNNGDLYIFSSVGKLQVKYELSGAYPMGIRFVNK